jgi:hypothetical protein
MAVHDPSSPRDLLAVLAALLTEVPLDGPVAVGLRVLPPGHGHRAQGSVALADRELELHFRHLDCTDAVCALCGFVAPADWQAFGVVAPAHSYPVDDDGGVGPGARAEVVVCALVDRAGRVVSEVRTDTGEVLASGPTEGRVVDACRRALGLPTAAPLSPPHVWATVLWVDAALAATLSADLGAAPTWSQLAALDTCGGPVRPLDWRTLRLACATGVLDIPGVAPDAAAWMDDGMFAREALRALPPLVDMLGDLRELLAAPVFAQVVERVCDRLGG